MSVYIEYISHVFYEICFCAALYHSVKSLNINSTYPLFHQWITFLLGSLTSPSFFLHSFHSILYFSSFFLSFLLFPNLSFPFPSCILLSLSLHSINHIILSLFISDCMSIHNSLIHDY